jgi:uncharacterized protein with HEPN domain
MPPEVLAVVPNFPWAEYADVADVIEPNHFRIDPPEIQRTLEAALDPLDDAMARVAAVR